MFSTICLSERNYEEIKIFIIHALCCSCDLGLHLMTFIYEIDLDILKIYLNTIIKFLSQGFQQLEPKQHTQRQIGRRD